METEKRKKTGKQENRETGKQKNEETGKVAQRAKLAQRGKSSPT